MVQPQFLADNRRIVLLSEQTGFRLLHILDPLYETVDALTQRTFRGLSDWHLQGPPPDVRHVDQG